MNLTIRNIPDDVIDKIKTLSVLEKRSINNEFLILLEKGLKKEMQHNEGKGESINPAIQIRIWEKLCGKWIDRRSTEKIIDDVVLSRSKGRKVNL